MAKISIIIPTYNRKTTLKKAVESVLNQTDRNWELIVVDDGSTDDTEKLMSSYTDNRIKYFKRKNHGIGASRNFGIENATGEYLTFVDSDDYLDESFVEKMYKKAKEEKLDMLVCDYYNFYKNKKIEEVHLDTFETTTLRKNPELINIVNLGPCNKIYKKSLFKKAENRFAEVIKYEDVNFVIKLLKSSESIGKFDECLNYFYVDNDSQTKTYDEKVFDIFKVLDIARKDLNTKVYKEALETLIVGTLTNYTVQQRYQKDKQIRSKFIKQAFNYMRYNVEDYKHNKYFNKRPFVKRIIEKSYVLTKLYCNIYAILKSK